MQEIDISQNEPKNSRNGAYCFHITKCIKFWHLNCNAEPNVHILYIIRW